MAIQFSRPIRRRVYAPGWGEVVVTFDAEGVRIREVGRLTTYDAVSYGFIARKGVELFTIRRKAERKAKLKARRKL